MYRPTPGPSTALYQLPPTPPSTPLGGVSASSPLLSAYDGMDDVLPALIAFDLDYTLWSGRMDSHYSGGEQLLSPSCAHKAFSNTRDGRQTGPLRRQTSTTLNQLLDGNDKRLSLYPQVAQILHRLQESQTHIAAISRTSSPEL
ncbi:hypothetical protein FRC04_001678 [Tulasnella sp. 424]|nr:hypothetical protein FRC04_001678 [Tulasnella sp. 424]